SIDVLKDGSAAAIYGARGSSGVILITTNKKSNREGTTNVSINTYGNLNKATNLIPILSPVEFVDRGGTDYGSRTNWRDEMLSYSFSASTAASVSGGFNNTNYLASVNYRDNKGVIKGVENNRLNARLNIRQGALDNKLRFNINLSVTKEDQARVNNDAFRYATIYNPTAPIFEDSEESEKYGGYFQRNLTDYFNPIALTKQQKFVSEIKSSLFSYLVEYDILDKLTLSAQYSQDSRNELAGNFWAKQDIAVGLGAGGSAQRITNDRVREIFESTLRFEKDFSNRLNMTLLGGGGLQTTKNQGFNGRSRQFLFDTGWDNLGGGAIRVGNNTELSSYANEDQLNSVFGRANFNYNNTFFFSASVR